MRATRVKYLSLGGGSQRCDSLRRLRPAFHAPGAKYLCFRKESLEDSCSTQESAAIQGYSLRRIMETYKNFAVTAAFGAALALLALLAPPAKAGAVPNGESHERAAIVSTILHRWYHHWYFKGDPRISPPRISRVGIAGNFAVAMVRLELDGAHYHGEFLLERFPFGWQTLEIASYHRLALSVCDLKAHDISPQTVRLLSERIGIAFEGNARYCPPPGTYADRGAPTSVLAIRKISHQGAVQSVRAVGNWGIAFWYGGGGGEAIYERKHARWVEISGGGGSACPQDLVDLYHMPLQTARSLLRGLVSGCK